MSAMRLRVFGALEVSVSGRAVPLPATMHRRLLTTLVVRRDNLCGTGYLLDALWGDAPPASAVKVLHTYVCALRQRLPGDLTIETVGSAYRLVGDWPTLLDAARFEQLVLEAMASTSDPHHAAAVLREAVSLHRGPAYAEFADEPCVLADACRLEELYQVAVARYLDVMLTLERHEEVLGDTVAIAVTNPLREHLVASVMLGLYRSGRQGDALRMYHRTRQALRQEIGVEPGEELQRRYAELLRHDPALNLPVAPHGAQRREAVPTAP